MGEKIDAWYAKAKGESKLAKVFNPALDAELRKLKIAEPETIQEIAFSQGVEAEVLAILKAPNFKSEGFTDFIKTMATDTNKVKRLKGIATALSNSPQMSLSFADPKKTKKEALTTNNINPELAKMESKLIPFVSNKADRQRILSNIELAGEEGKKLASHISKGAFEQSQGYYIIISALSKRANNEQDLIHQTKVANQTFDKADALLDIHKDPILICFEHKGGADFDIDLGIKNNNSTTFPYYEVYQFKNIRSPLDANVLDNASKQLPMRQLLLKLLQLIAMKKQQGIW